jgi:hypothetical protein
MGAGGHIMTYRSNWNYTRRKPSFKEKLNTYLLKTFLFLLATVFCFVPAELWVAIYKFASPVGFWEKFAITGGGILIFGSAQFILFIVWCVLIFVIISED